MGDVPGAQLMIMIGEGGFGALCVVSRGGLLL